MAQKSNEVMLARALALNEIGGEVLEDLPGGCLAKANRGWLLIYDLEKAGDPEQAILMSQGLVKENGIELGGAVLVFQPKLDKNQAVKDFAEALFVYGMPQEEGSVETIQVLAGSPKTKPAAEIRSGSGELEQGMALLQNSGFEWNTLLGGPGQLELGSAAPPQCHCAYAGDEAAGAVFYVCSGLVARITSVFVKEGHREKGVGSLLVKSVAEAAAQQGMPLVSIWCNKLDPARYFYSKAGFEDQLHCLTFLAE